MKRKLSVLLVLVVSLAVVGCGGNTVKSPLDTVSDSVSAATHGYVEVEKLLIAAHNAGAINDSAWAQISHIRNKYGQPALGLTLDAWELYAQSPGAPSEATIMAQLTGLLTAAHSEGLLSDAQYAQVTAIQVPVSVAVTFLFDLITHLKTTGQVAEYPGGPRNYADCLNLQRLRSEIGETPLYCNSEMFGGAL